MLINPAVHPECVLSRFLGIQRNPFSGEEYEITAEHFAELSEFRVGALRFRNDTFCWCRQATKCSTGGRPLSFYAGAWQFIQGGGDHAYRGFVEQTPLILRFAGMD